jgi:PGF-pre-PGF domain-containing protein
MMYVNGVYDMNPDTARITAQAILQTIPRIVLVCIILAGMFMLQVHVVSATILSTSNGTISIGASSGTIEPVISPQSGDTITIIFHSASSNSSNSTSSSSSNADINEGLTPSEIVNPVNVTNDSSVHQVPEINVTLQYSNLKAGAVNTRDIAIQGLPITRLTFTATHDITNATIFIRMLPARPVSTEFILNPVYAYFEMVKTNLSNVFLANISISFTVPQSWIAAQGINKDDLILKRWTLTWEDVATTHVQDGNSEQGSVAAYTAHPAGMSYFAIVSKRKGSGALDQITGAVMKNDSQGKDFQLVKQDDASGASDAGTSGIFGLSGPMLWGGIMLIIVIIGALIMRRLGSQGKFSSAKGPLTAMDSFQARAVNRSETPGALRGSSLFAPAKRQENIGRGVGQSNQNNLDESFSQASSGQADQVPQAGSGGALRSSVPQAAIRRKLQELNKYIDVQRASGASDADIAQTLSRVGWRQHVIDLVLYGAHAPRGEHAMADENLVGYARTSLAKGYRPDQIRAVLRRVGWPSEAIEEALTQAGHTPSAS